MSAALADITGYYDESRSKAIDGLRTLGEILDWDEAPPRRWPVLNREPRVPINSQKRAIIHERDGGMCRYCATTDEILVVDHIVPRSAFPASQLRIADRSDNLHSACWTCNEGRSNYESEHTKRLGVVAACFYCVNPEYAEEDCLEWLEPPGPVDVLVFCGRCGVSTVPEVEGWVL